MIVRQGTYRAQILGTDQRADQMGDRREVGEEQGGDHDRVPVGGDRVVAFQPPQAGFDGAHERRVRELAETAFAYAHCSANCFSAHSRHPSTPAHAPDQCFQPFGVW